MNNNLKQWHNNKINGPSSLLSIMKVHTTSCLLALQFFFKNSLLLLPASAISCKIYHCDYYYNTILLRKFVHSSGHNYNSSSSFFLLFSSSACSCCLHYLFTFVIRWACVLFKYFLHCSARNGNTFRNNSYR